MADDPLGLPVCLASGAAKVTDFDPTLVKLAVAYRRYCAAFLLGRLDLRRRGLESLRDSDMPVDKVLWVGAREYLGDRTKVLRRLSPQSHRAVKLQSYPGRWHYPGWPLHKARTFGLL